MTARIIDAGYTFAVRRVEADIERIRKIADTAVARIMAETDAKRNRIDALLSRIERDVELPSDVEWPEAG